MKPDHTVTNPAYDDAGVLKMVRIDGRTFVHHTIVDEMAAQSAAAEREAIAKLVENHFRSIGVVMSDGEDGLMKEIAAAIRARGKNESLAD